VHWLLVKVLCPTQHKIGHFRDVPKPISWLGIEKQNPTQQKHTFTNQKKCTTTQNKEKTKARFSHLLRHLAWKRRGLILVLALHKFVTYLLTSTLTYLQPWTHTEPTKLYTGWKPMPVMLCLSYLLIPLCSGCGTYSAAPLSTLLDYRQHRIATLMTWVTSKMQSTLPRVHKLSILKIS